MVKSYIFWCSYHEKAINIYDLQQRIKQTFRNQQFIAEKNGKQYTFNKKWSNWIPLINDI